MELERQIGFGSISDRLELAAQIRKAMVRPERTPLAARVEADETYVGGPGRASRGAAPAPEQGRRRGSRSGRGQARGAVSDACASP